MPPSSGGRAVAEHIAINNGMYGREFDEVSRSTFRAQGPCYVKAGWDISSGHGRYWDVGRQAPLALGLGDARASPLANSEQCCHGVMRIKIVVWGTLVDSYRTQAKMSKKFFVKATKIEKVS